MTGAIRAARVAVLAAGALCLLSPNPALSVAALGSLWLLWTGALTSAFTAAITGYLSYQWLQVSMKIWLANAFGIDLHVPQVTDLCGTCPLEVHSTTGLAISLGLASLLATSFACRALAPKTAMDLASIRLRPDVLLLLYFVLAPVKMLAGPLSFLSQPILFLSSMKYVFIILLAYGWASRRTGFPHLVAAITAEIAVGLTGYFAHFTTVFFIVGIGMLPVIKSHWRRIRLAVLVAVPLLALLGSVWQAIKPTYRSILNAGTESQTVQIGLKDQLGALQSLSANLGQGDVLSGFIRLGLRLQYVDFLANTLEQVPAVTPHQGGAVWGDAIYHIVTPRFLFPDKPGLPSDSQHTMRYTGRILASGDKGTSISIGYVGDSYIDFGLLGAVGLSFLVGIYYSALGRLLLRTSSETPVLVATLVVSLQNARTFEISAIKMFPGLLWSGVVGVIFVRALWPLLRPYVSVHDIQRGKGSTIVAERGSGFEFEGRRGPTRLRNSS